MLRRAMKIRTAVVAIALVVSSSALGQAAHTHWEPYKNASTPPSVDQKLTDPVLAGAIDLHAHYGPDSYPRQWDAFEVASLAQARGLRGVVLKNHWSETAGIAYLVRKYGVQGIEVFGAVTLDTPTGGVNPQAVRYMVDVTGGWGRIVWMPTHDSEHEVAFHKQQRPFVRVVSRRRALTRDARGDRLGGRARAHAGHGARHSRRGTDDPRGSAQTWSDALDRHASVARPAVHVHVGAAATRGRRAGRESSRSRPARFSEKVRDARACSKPSARSGRRASSSRATAGSSEHRITPMRSSWRRECCGKTVWTSTRST